MSFPEKFSSDLFKFEKRKSLAVKVGNVIIGGNNPIVVQSMTTEDTLNTKKVLEQSIRMIDSGCEIVRLTAPSLKEATHLKKIKEELIGRGYQTPLVADIHFTPNAAEIAAEIVEKVRINPGNYADKKKNQYLEYTDISYQEELERIREKLLPLIKICKKHKTAMRIGTNHGSLSDRIMSRYGDTPLGMVESALEFTRICQKENYNDIVISMKSSNPQVMVQAYRLLVQKLNNENLPPYPLHLGVTEAGEGEDGRIKSAMGIGTLLADGLGDTIRVSLTEEPEYEIPVAEKIVKRFEVLKKHQKIKHVATDTYSPFEYKKRKTVKINQIGGGQPPLVFADMSKSPFSIDDGLKALGHHKIQTTGKEIRTDQSADMVYWGNKLPSDNLPESLIALLDYAVWKNMDTHKKAYPVITIQDLQTGIEENLVKLQHCDYVFLALKVEESDKLLSYIEYLKNCPLVLIVETDNTHKMMAFRSFFLELQANKIDLPVVLKIEYSQEKSLEDIALEAAVDIGAALLDGWGNGVWLTKKNTHSLEEEKYFSTIKTLNQLAFNILQAGRQRITKTEYISCPSCGRTLFDLQETTAKIRAKTEHLKGVKIGIMGCIVNGPGEMADADYGYVGSGKNKITLYRGQEVVKRGINTENAVDELMNLIAEDGKWEETSTINKN